MDFLKTGYNKRKDVCYIRLKDVNTIPRGEHLMAINKV